MPRPGFDLGPLQVASQIGPAGTVTQKGCLPMKYIIEQQTVLFYRPILRGSNVVLRSLLHQKVGYVNCTSDLSESVCRGH